MPISQDEIIYLQAQLEGLECVLFEIIPLKIELKRQQVQEYFDKRLELATKPYPLASETELKRQFNTKANQVRNLIDLAESRGSATNPLNLMQVASCLPDEKNLKIREEISEFCKGVLFNKTANPTLLGQIIEFSDINSVEARLLLSASMFSLDDNLDYGGEALQLADLLAEIIGLVKSEQLLTRNDPFLIEAQCALAAMEPDSEE